MEVARASTVSALLCAPATRWSFRSGFPSRAGAPGCVAASLTCVDWASASRLCAPYGPLGLLRVLALSKTLARHSHQASNLRGPRF